MTYDAAKDAAESYNAAIAAKKARGDTHDWVDRPPVAIRVTVQPGKPALRELMIDGLKVYEFPNRAQFTDFVMQSVSALRYD